MIVMAWRIGRAIRGRIRQFHRMARPRRRAMTETPTPTIVRQLGGHPVAWRSERAGERESVPALDGLV